MTVVYIQPIIIFLESYLSEQEKLHALQIAGATNCMCCKLYVFQIASFANCMCCKFHCCKLKVLQIAVLQIESAAN